MIPDTTRELRPEEWALLQRFQAKGIHPIAGLPCWQANPALQAACPATVGTTHPLTGTFPLVESLRQTIALRHPGGADLAAIRRFQPKLAESPALRIHGPAAADTQALATATMGAVLVGAGCSLILIVVGERQRPSPDPGGGLLPGAAPGGAGRRVPATGPGPPAHPRAPPEPGHPCPVPVRPRRGTVAAPLGGGGDPSPGH